MRKITLLVLFCCTHLMMMAQTKSTNTNETPARVKCYTTEYMSELRRANPRMQTDEQFEQFMAAAIAKRKSDIERGTVQPLAGPYVINVIVHVLHSGQAVGTYPNLLQRQVASQIRVLNEDFNRTNADAANTPAVFVPVAGSVGGTAPAGGGIVFQLARQDPAGNLLAEAGVHRYQIPAAASYSTTLINGTFKPATSWDNTRYMNIWTINAPTSTSGALYGYAQFPDGSGLAGLGASGGASNTDGLVIAADAFGSNYDAAGVILPVGQRYQFSSGADKGRTVTHELGHGLGLRHIWGDAACGDDFCADTPVAATSNVNPCYTHPKNSTCAGGAPEMFMNYMDYTLDACMNIFTQNQMTRMVTVMNVSPGRNTLTAATVGNCPVGTLGLTRPTGAYPNAGVGQTYTQTNVGTGGGTPNPATGAGYVYTLTSGTLPAGLTLNTATGVISGVASAIGTSNFSITPSGAAGVNAAGASTACLGVAVAYTIQVVASSCLPTTILPATGALPNAAPGVAYSQAITASGATAPYTFSISSGALPTGFTLSSAGVISGTSASPQTAASFTVLATDATTPAACQAVINYTLAVVVPPCVPTAVISTYPHTQNFDGITTVAYTDNPYPTSVVPVGTTPTNTNLPCGWSVNNVNNDNRSWANFTGVANSPTNSAVYSYNGTNIADDWMFSPGLAMNAGQTYNISLQYKTGPPDPGPVFYPEKFEIVWGTSPTPAAMLPANQIFNTPATGVTNQTFTAAGGAIVAPTTGTYYVGIRVYSAANQYYLTIDDFSVTTTAPVCATTTVSSTPTGPALSYTVGTAIPNITMSASGVAGTYTYSITAGVLPAGVTMTTAGVISGTPTAAASGTFTVTATNGACTGIKPFTYSVVCPTITVDSAPTPTALTLVVNTAMPNITMSTTGATGTFVYAITAGALPTGVTMTAGVISGTPTVLTASGTFTVTSTYGTNCTATKVFTYSVIACPVTFTPATGGTLTAGVIGNTYSINITSNRTGAVFTATGLPAGLAISATGAITGTPSAVVSTANNVVVTATSGACIGTATYTLAVGQNPATAIDGTLSSQVKVYPNPSKADFNIDFASLNLGKVAIRVYDVQGKQVFTTSTSDNTTVISLEKFAKGMYLMEIESQKGRILKRIVKE
jgi:hypothetical protein